MTNLGKYFSLASFGFALTAVNLPAQDYNSLPDDPGQALLAKATKSRDALPDDPGQAFLAKAASSYPFPSDPGKTQKPTVDTTTGVPQREATWRSMPGDFLHDQKALWTFPFRVFRG